MASQPADSIGREQKGGEWGVQTPQLTAGLQNRLSQALAAPNQQGTLRGPSAVSHAGAGGLVPTDRVFPGMMCSRG